MRRIVIAATVAALAVALLAATGCGLFKNPTEDANKAIAEGNTHLKKYQESTVKVGELGVDLRSLETTPGGAATALEILGKMKTELAVQKTELDAASKAIAKVKTFEVEASFKKYADLEIAAIAAKIALADANGELYTQMERMYAGIRDKKATSAFTSEILVAIDAATKKVDDLTAAHQKASDEASAYFDKMASEQK